MLADGSTAGRYESVSFHDRGIKRHGIEIPFTRCLSFFFRHSPVFLSTSIPRLDERENRREIISPIIEQISFNFALSDFLGIYYNITHTLEKISRSIPNVAEFLRVERDNFLRCRDGKGGLRRRRKREQQDTVRRFSYPFPILIWKTRFFDEGREKEKKRGGKIMAGLSNSISQPSESFKRLIKRWRIKVTA